MRATTVTASDVERSVDRSQKRPKKTLTLRLHAPHASARLRLEGWHRDVDDPRDARLQWAKGRDISWDGVLDGTSAANRFLLVTALTRKADLATTLSRHKDAVGENNAPAYASMPETFVIDPEDSDEEDEEEGHGDFRDSRTDRESALRDKTVPRAVRRGGGGAQGFRVERRRRHRVFDAGDAAAGARRAVHERARRALVRGDRTVGRAEVRRVRRPRRRGAPRRRTERRGPNGRPSPKFKFHLRAHALVAGDASAYVHDDVVVLVASAPVRARQSVRSARARHQPQGARARPARAWKIAGRRRLKRGRTRYAARDARVAGRRVSRGFFLVGSREREAGRPGRLDLCADRLASAYAPSRRTRSRRRARPGAAGFVPIGGSFELFGLDFLVDAESGAPRLLEINSDPSMAVFGAHAEGRRRCAALLRDVLSIALPRMETGRETGGDDEGDGGEAPATVRREKRLDTRANTNAFRKVWSARPRFPDPAEGRRRVKRLVSLTASLAARVARGGDQASPATRRASVAAGSPGAAGAAPRCGARGLAHESDPRAPACSLQWAPHRLIRWDRVMDWRVMNEEIENDNENENDSREDTGDARSHGDPKESKGKDTERGSFLPGFLVANHHFSRAGLFKPEALADAVDARDGGGPSFRPEERSGTAGTDSSGARPTRRSTVRAFALVVGSRASMRVAVRRRVEGLEAFLTTLTPRSYESTRAFAIVAEAAKRAFEAAAAFRGGGGPVFLPFANCFETYAVTLLVETAAEDSGAFRARVVRVEDAFASDGKERARRGTDLDALADAAVAAALPCFFGREEGDASASDCLAEDAFEFV